MRTLYVRIFFTTIFIMIISALLAFIATNIYYHYILKPQNDEKVTHIAKNIVEIFAEGEQDVQSYLASMTHLGYTFHLFDESGFIETFGEPFKGEVLPEETVKSVIDGEIYHGIKNYPWRLFVTGFFSNDLQNTIGVPIQYEDDTYALFVRQHTVIQFGEMRIFLAVLLVIVLIFTFVGILLSTQYIVKPIKDLTRATNKIAAGNYHVKLNVKRTDEIGRLARDFTKMSNSLEKTEEKRQEFVSSVSHEIQSPLTSIQGFSQALQEEDLSKEEQKHYLSIIENESRRLSQLSRQLLTLSFLDRNEGKDFVSFDVYKQLKEVISTTEWQWRRKDLAMELNGSSVNMVGDPKLLYQVWMNLLTNAIRYTDEGGTVTVNLEELSAHIKVGFKDTGIGIAEEHLSHLFDRFYKVDKARTRKDESTGLGLSIAKKIVELHDGTIVVDSELHQGTVFTIKLPKQRG